MSEAGDGDVRRTVANGRRTLGAMLSAVQSDLQKVFVVFLVGFLGTFYGFQVYVWDWLKADLLAPSASVNALTPADVPLLQAKIGIVVGVLVSLPALLYYAREPLRARGVWPTVNARAKLAAIALLAGGLFLAGVAYAYFFLFPLLFGFFASNALAAGFVPQYSIVKWVEFVFLLSLAMGIAAELPLVMAGLAYSGTVRHETFRERWRYAVVAIAIVASVINGSPDPISMSIVALPMVLLYGVGLLLTRTITGARNTTERTVVSDAPGSDAGSHTPPSDATGDPSAVDLAALDAEGVRAAPIETFAGRSEDGVLEDVERAIEEERPEKAQAILDRFETAREHIERAESADGPVADEGTDDAATGVEGTGETDGERGVLTRTTTGMVDAFTEEDTTEEEIGGYYYDLAFVLSTLRSRSFRLLGLFGVVLVGSFAALSRGGIGFVREDFLSRLPPALAEDVDVVALHPVEALSFEIKLSTLLAAIAVAPFVLYYAWPALKSRGFASGDRRVLLVWAGALFVGLAGGTAVGYAVVAPRLIGWLARDALTADMVIGYRISAAGWLVIFTTVGVGVLGTIPVSMVLLHRGGIVSYELLFGRWREVTVTVFALTGYLSPRGVFMMFVLGIPIVLAYGLGLGVIYLYTLGGRRVPSSDRGRHAD